MESILLLTILTQFTSASVGIALFAASAKLIIDADNKARSDRALKSYGDCAKRLQLARDLAEQFEQRERNALLKDLI